MSTVERVAADIDSARVAGIGGIVAPAREDAVGAGGDGAAKYRDNGGPVIAIPRVQLVYWGSAWASARPRPNPSPDQITAAVRDMLAGPYMTGLAEYRQVGRGHLLGATVISSSTPPSNFDDSDIVTFLRARIADGTLPGPDQFNQNLYVVVMPQGVTASGSFIGEHTYYTDSSGGNVHYAWVTNDGQLDSLTSILSHELVESCTDPEGSAVLGLAGTCSQTGWCEIADICSSTAQRNGVTVQSFWSDQAGECIVPDWPALQFPIKGVQFQAQIPAGATERWFTYNWPEYWFVLWEMVPVTVNGGGPAISWQVAIERPSGAYATYWITVTNQTDQDINFEARYTILGIPS
jgi:hypothetical protein